MTRNRNQHVVPAKDGWAVKRAGSPKATKVFDTQEEAIEKGREIAKNQRSELLIHGRDGEDSEEEHIWPRLLPTKGMSLLPAVGSSPWDSGVSDIRLSLVVLHR